MAERKGLGARQGTARPPAPTNRATSPVVDFVRNTSNTIRDTTRNIIAPRREAVVVKKEEEPKQNILENLARMFADGRQREIEDERQRLQRIRENPASTFSETALPGVRFDSPLGLTMPIVPLAQEALLKPALRAGATFAVTGAELATGKEQKIPDSPLSRSLFNGVLSDGVSGEKGGEVRSLSSVFKGISKGEGFGGDIAKFGQEKLGIDPRISAPLIGLGLVASDLNPIPDPKDATNVARKLPGLLDDAGRLLNVTTDAGKVINQVDLLNSVRKVASKVDDASAVVQRADGALRVLPQKQVATYLARNEGAEVLSTVGDVAKRLGFSDAKTYADEGAKLLDVKKISKTDDFLRRKTGLDPKESAAITTKPYEPVPIKANIEAKAAEVKNPIEEAATITIKSQNDLEQAAAVFRRLMDDGSDSSRQAANVLLSRVADSPMSSEAGRFLRTMQELRARMPKGLVDEYTDALKRVNETRLAAGKAEIPVDPRTAEQLDLIGMRLNRVPEGSMEANALMSEATGLFKRAVPQGLGDRLGSWFVSSILSGPATGVAQLFGYGTMLPAEGASRVLQGTLGNLATKTLFGVQSAAQPQTLKGLGAGYDAAKAMGSDFLRGTNSFTDSTSLERGAKNFQASAERFDAALRSKNPARIAEEAGVAVADVTERLANLFSNVEAPARGMFQMNRLTELESLVAKAGQDVSDPVVQRWIIDQATKETDFRFYTNPGWLSKKINGLRKVLGEGSQADKLLSKIVVPFATVPANLLSRGVVDYSPLGFAKTIGSFAKLVSGRKTLSSLDKLALAREFSQSASRALVGTGIYGGAALMAELGVMTFGRDPREKVADMQSAQRIPMLGLNVSGVKRALEALTKGSNFEDIKGAAGWQNGDTWIDYGNVQPLAPGIALAGSIYNSVKEDPSGDLGSKVARSVDATLKGILGAPMFTNFRLAGNAAQSPSTTIERFVGNVVAGLLTPGYLSFAAQLGDQEKGKGIVRETFTGNLGEGILNNLKNRIPGLRQTLPQAVDLGGDKVYNDSAIMSSLGRAISPQSIEVPATAQVGMNLLDTTGSTRAIPTRFDKKGERFGIDYALDAKDLVWARSVYGKATDAALRQLLNDPAFRAKTTVQQESAISEKYSEISGALSGFFAAKEIGAAQEHKDIPWYKWDAIITDIRRNKDAQGRVIFDVLRAEDKKKMIANYLK